MADEFAGRVRVVKVDVDRDAAVRKAFRVDGIPTYLVYKDGVEVDRLKPSIFVEARLRGMVEAALN